MYIYIYIYDLYNKYNNDYDVWARPSHRRRAAPRAPAGSCTGHPRRTPYGIPYYTVLYCTVLYYTILYYTILYYTTLYYTILWYCVLKLIPNNNNNNDNKHNNSSSSSSSSIIDIGTCTGHPRRTPARASHVII